MMGSQNNSEEIDPLTVFPQNDFARMKMQAQAGGEKSFDEGSKRPKGGDVLRDYDKIIGVTDIMPQPQILFHPLIQLMQIHIGENLRCQVAERKSFPFPETADDRSEQMPQRWIGDAACKKLEKDFMIHRREEPVDVALQGITNAGVIHALLAEHRLQRTHCSMRPLASPTGERMRDECGLENRSQCRDDGMVHDAVAHCRFVNKPLLRISDGKRRVRPVAVGARSKLTVKIEYPFL